MISSILGIFIGNNSNDLFGCENDALLFYNLKNPIITSIY